MKYKYRILVLTILFFGQHLCAQQIPEEMRPFVRLGRSVKILTFENPRFDQESNKLTNLGQLVDLKIMNIPVGSGTIISSDGLILTNYHVYQMKNQLSYDDASNTIKLMKSDDSSMLVYTLADNDPLKPPVLQYHAEPVSLDQDHDTALLKIVTNKDGNDISEKNFPCIPVGNPYSLTLNNEMLILGYPAKGGNTITVTDGKFLGYYLNEQYMGRDGFIKTNAAMSPGNSGGTALHQNKMVGVPTAVTLPSLAGSDMGYIHPITWAAKVLTVAERKYGFTTPEMPLQWFQNDYNTDETVKNIYITGTIISANSRKPLPALAIVARTDRTYEQIREIHQKVQEVFIIVMIQQMYKSGASVEDIAAYLNIPVNKTEEIVHSTVSLETLPSDVQNMLKGEFFYNIARADEDGFFIISAPRDKKLKLYMFQQDHYLADKTITSRSGRSQILGNLKLYKQQ